MAKFLKNTFFAGKKCEGVYICPKGLISTKIFALYLQNRIFKKNHKTAKKLAQVRYKGLT